MLSMHPAKIFLTSKFSYVLKLGLHIDGRLLVATHLPIKLSSQSTAGVRLWPAFHQSQQTVQKCCAKTILLSQRGMFWLFSTFNFNLQSGVALTTLEYAPIPYFFPWRFAEEHYETVGGLEKCTFYKGPPTGLVAGNDCFSLAKYNDWPMWWELNSLSLCRVHLFRFLDRDGGETKQCTPDVINCDRGLLLGMLLPSWYDLRKHQPCNSTILVGRDLKKYQLCRSFLSVWIWEYRPASYQPKIHLGPILQLG
jgi:hypothetical protein